MPVDHKSMKDPTMQQARFVEMLDLAKKALIIIFKNWSGFIMLGKERLAI